MEKLTLTRVLRLKEDKEGKPLVNKKGVPYTRLLVKAEEHGDTWISGFANSASEDWSEGDVVEAKVEKKGEYLNLSVSKSSASPLEPRITALEDRVELLEKSVTVEDAVSKKDDKTEDYPELKDDSLPFD